MKIIPYSRQSIHQDDIDALTEIDRSDRLDLRLLERARQGETKK